jgi:hypothetical protein
VLDDADVRTLNERALTAEEVEQRESLTDYEDVAEEGGVVAFGVVALGEGRRTLSWIWYTAKGDGEPTEQELVEGACDLFGGINWDIDWNFFKHCVWTGARRTYGCADGTKT